MSCIPSWLAILLFVAPCHRAGDLTTESTQIGIVAGGASDDKNEQKYLPSSKSFVAEWSFEKPLWRNVNSTIPQMREEAATWSDPDSGDWWLFGGHRSIMSKKGSHVNKEKMMKKNRFEKNMAKHNANGGLTLPLTMKYYSDLWHYQPSLRLWTRIYPSSSSSIPAPGGPDHPLTRPILCGGGGNKPSPQITRLDSYDSNRNIDNSTSNESLTEGTSKVGKVDGRVMAVYAPGSKPVDTVWLLEMNDTRLWTTYVCCDEDSSMTEKSDRVQEERKGKTEELGNQEKASERGSTNSDQGKSVNGDIKNPAKNATFEEGPLTFCPDFHTLTRPPITWCDKQSQALFALDITSFKPRMQDQENAQNFSLAQNNTEAPSTEKEGKTISWIPRLWRFDLGLTQWEHISVKNLTKFSDLWKCGKDTATMHWTSLDKCLIVLCPVLGGPSNLFHSLSMCMEGDGPKLQTLGTIQLSQGASQARQWTISAVESSLSGRKYLLLAYGRLLDLWVLEQGSKNWSPLENIWQGAALKWFRANMGLYHLQIVEDGIARDKKENEEEEEDKVEELEEGKALGIAHVGEIGINSLKKYNSTNVSFISSKNKILASSIRKEGMMEVFMVNPRDGLDVTLREQGLFIIRISEDNGTIFGRKAEIHNKEDNQEKELIGDEKDIELTTLPGQPTDEVLNLSSQANSKKDDENIRNEFTETSDVFYLPTTTTTLRAEEGESEIYDQNQGESEEEDDEWSAELVLETNGSSPVLNASLLALVEDGGNVEIDDGLGKEANPAQNGIDGSHALNHLSTDVNNNLNQISGEPLIEASAIVNLEQDQADKMGVIRPLSIEENEMGRGSITLGALGSEEESGYQGTILFFAVSFSMFMLFVVVVFLRRFVVNNCHFASHHLPHRCRSNSSVLLKEPPPIRYSVIPDEVCYAGMNSAAMPAPGSPIPPSSIHSTLSKPLTT